MVKAKEINNKLKMYQFPYNYTGILFPCMHESTISSQILHLSQIIFDLNHFLLPTGIYISVISTLLSVHVISVLSIKLTSM